ncbi:aminoacyl tRNA synthase complex-interacting multifunctional protein 1-like [Macrosteles quadrilineatus]|uniref:aminoacyl tRNA synthase complex-interacting multifunctional protein 1-like n=1 Tax=Macrosteles quadrilineatus TaxID=74068 RepID=UPI0023E0C282|nr:aminoacyl tRNA synthase complex-interacting multifunctional protein 1-like [Macrosteles quadrilineatus]
MASALPQVGGEIYFPHHYNLLPTELHDTFKELDGAHKLGKRPPVDFSILDIRVGRILRVTKNPASVKALKKSYVCRVEIGWERAPRVIVVELAKYYTRDQLKLAKCVVLCNITPVSIFGQRSWGWILAAETPDKDLELLRPPPETDMTEQVTVWGFPPVKNLREEPELNVKQLKKLFKDMRVNAEGVAEWQGMPMCVEGGTNPIRAGRYARDTPIINALKNRSWSKYKTPTFAEYKKQFREYML